MAIVLKNDLLPMGFVGENAPLTVDNRGRLRVHQPRDIVVTSGITVEEGEEGQEAMGALSVVTDVEGPFILLGVAVAIDDVPSDSEDIVVTLDAAGGADYDVPLYTVDPSTEGDAGVSEIFWQPSVTIYCEDGDQIKVAYPNTGADTVSARIVVERI